jgi:peptidylprolyl isomerase
MSVKEGDKVAIQYTGRLEDGTVFDSNVGDKPLEFVVGSGEVIEGFDKAVRGLAPGKPTQFKLTPDEAYGQRDEELVIPVRKEIFGEQQPEAGMDVALKGQDGTVFNGRVEKIEDEQVMVDLNHPLAGQVLEFEVEVVNVHQ